MAKKYVQVDWNLGHSPPRAVPLKNEQVRVCTLCKTDEEHTVLINEPQI